MKLVGAQTRAVVQVVVQVVVRYYCNVVLNALLDLHFVMITASAAEFRTFGALGFGFC